MSQKNETPILILSLLITGGLVGGGFWFFNPKPGVNINPNNNSNSPSSESNVQTIAQVQNIPKGKFFYGGSSTWATIRKEVDSAISIVSPQFQLIYKHPPNIAPSSDTGISMLIDNQLDFSQSSSPVPNKYYELAKNKGFILKEIPVAIDAIAIVVHPSLNIKGLTIQQVEDIYNGKIRNWKDVGGPNLIINPYSRVKDAPPFQKFAYTTTEALRLLANDPGGIYKASATLAVSQCNVKTVPLADNKSGKIDFIPPYQEPFIPLSECPNKRNKLNIEGFKNGTYPYTRRLFVVVKKDGQLAEKAGDSYAKMLLTDQGQQLIEKAGFVPLR